MSQKKNKKEGFLSEDSNNEGGAHEWELCHLNMLSYNWPRVCNG